MAAPLRIQTSLGGTTTPLQSYFERLLKLVPAEVIGLYQAGIGIIPPTSRWAVLSWALVGLAAVILVRAYATSDRKVGQRVQWAAVVISAIAYAIWIYTLQGSPFDLFGLYVPALASLLVLVWTFIVPYVYHGDS